MKQSADKWHLERGGRTTLGAHCLLRRCLQLWKGATQAAKQEPPPPTSKTLQGKGGRQGAGMGGQIHVWGRQLSIPLRLFLPKLQAEEFRTPGLPAKAPQLRSTLQFSPGWLCSSPVAIPRSSSLAWLPSPPGTTQSPAPSPRTQIHFPLRILQTSNIFPPPLHVCHRTRMHES